MSDIEVQIEAAFAEAGVRGFLFARDIDGDATLGVSPDDLVCLASVLKIPIAPGCPARYSDTGDQARARHKRDHAKSGDRTTRVL